MDICLFIINSIILLIFAFQMVWALFIGSPFNCLALTYTHDCLFYILNIPLLSDTIRYFNIILFNASSFLELVISLKKPDSTYGRRVLEDLGAGGLFVSVVMLNS